MDTDAVLRLLVDVAEDVVNPRFRSLTSGEIHEKAPGDLVTDADREAETLIGRALRAAYPDAVILGEEAYAADRGILAAFGAADHAFTIDPVDGTKNFVHGSPDHAMMVSEIQTGVVVRAWIWQPQHEAAYVAERGAGAFRNGERLVCPPVADDPSSWRGVTSRRSWIGRSLGRFAPLELTWVSCGIDYPHLAEGDADFVLYSGTHPWDHAPGSLLLAEAGGILLPVADEEYAPQAEVRKGTGPVRLLAARSHRVGAAVRDLLLTAPPR